MSLRAFHVVFITASVLLSLGVAKYYLPAHPVRSAVAVGVAMGLVAYEAWFLRKTRTLA